MFITRRYAARAFEKCTRIRCVHAEYRAYFQVIFFYVFRVQVSSSQRAPRDLNFPYSLLTILQGFFSITRCNAFVKTMRKLCKEKQTCNQIFSIETIQTIDLKNPRQTWYVSLAHVTNMKSTHTFLPLVIRFGISHQLANQRSP